MNNTSNPGRPAGSMPSGMRADRPRHVEWSTDVDNWMDDAACQGQHPKAHHRGLPDADRSVLEWVEGDPRTKKKYCNGGQLRWFDGRAVTVELPVCPVREKCLQRALKMDPLPAHGVWGGLDPTELRDKVQERSAPLVVGVAPKLRGVEGPDCTNAYGAKRHRRKGELPCYACAAYETEQQNRWRARRTEQQESA